MDSEALTMFDIEERVKQVAESAETSSSSLWDHVHEHLLSPSRFERDKPGPRGMSESFNIEQESNKIVDLLNQGRSDQAVKLLSKGLSTLSGQSYNDLLVSIAAKQTPEIEGDMSGHLLLSDWNISTGTWDQVYVSERDQLYRIVQPGNTLESIAADRLGSSADSETIARYAKNIAEVNSIPAPELIVTGQALRLPYPY